MLVLDDGSKLGIKPGAIVSGGSHHIFRISRYLSFISGISSFAKNVYALPR